MRSGGGAISQPALCVCVSWSTPPELMRPFPAVCSLALLFATLERRGDPTQSHCQESQRYPIFRTSRPKTSKALVFRSHASWCCQVATCLNFLEKCCPTTGNTWPLPLVRVGCLPTSSHRRRQPSKTRHENLRKPA